MKPDAMSTQIEMIKEISEHIGMIKSNVDKMIEARKKANKIENARAKAVAYCDDVKTTLKQSVITWTNSKLWLTMNSGHWQNTENSFRFAKA